MICTLGDLLLDRTDALAERHRVARTGKAEETASSINSLTMAGVYFLPLRVSGLCWVETTTLVQPIASPLTYCTVT